MNNQEKLPTYNNEEETSNTLVDIINQLMNANWNKVYLAVENYLTKIDKKEYMELIFNLIKLCILENDMTFIRPLKMLSAIYLDDLDFDIEQYINDFYVTLAENDKDKEKLYIEIILSLANLKENYQLPNQFLKLINKEEDKENSSNIQIFKFLEEKTSKIQDTQDGFKNYVDQQCKILMQQKGAILICPGGSGKKKKIQKLICAYPDIMPLSIGNSPNSYIILRYKPTLKDYINVKDLINLGNTAYYQKKYKLAINYYLQVLQIGKPKAIAYVRLGFSYLYLGDIKAAINYLLIAQEVSKNEERKYNFTNMVEELQASTHRDDKKRYFQMEIEDFKEKNYGVNFEEINEYILKTGLDVETVCEIFKLTNEQIDVIMLLYAKSYYMQGFCEKGDEFFKIVAKKQNKSHVVIKLLEDIRNNKKLYLIKKGNENTISLTIKPIKNKRIK